jgi:hypothetical protein
MLKFTLISLLLVSVSFCGALDSEVVTHKALVEISIDNDPAGKIEISLFGKTVPETVENF